MKISLAVDNTLNILFISQGRGCLRQILNTSTKMSSTILNKSLLDTAALLVQASQNLIDIANQSTLKESVPPAPIKIKEINAPAPTPIINAASKEVKVEFENEPLFQPRAHQIIDSKTIEKAIYFLEAGVSRRDIATKFNLDNFLCYECCRSVERQYLRGMNRREHLSSSEKIRIQFFSRFYTISSVAKHFNVSSLPVINCCKDIASKINTSRGRSSTFIHINF